MTTCGDFGGVKEDGTPCGRAAGWGVDGGIERCRDHDDGSLTMKQQAFVERYCTHFNATQAALEAGYSERSAYSIGSENLKKPEIAQALTERLDQHAMTAAEALKRLADWGRGSPLPFLRVTAGGEVLLDLSTAEAQQHLHLVRKIKVDESRIIEGDEADLVKVKTEIELHDAKDAVKQIARAHGLFVDRHEVTGKDGEPLEVNVHDARERLNRRISGVASRIGAGSGAPGANSNGASGS